MNPETVYENKFTNWVHYLSIGNVYYDLSSSKQKVHEFVCDNLKNNYTNDDLFFIISELSKNDKQFPPPNLLKDYLKLNDLTDLINIDEMSYEKVSF